MRKSKIFSLGAGGAVAAGVLQLASGAALDTTLRAVTDQAGTLSPLQLSTTQVGMLGDTFFGASSSTTNILTLQSTTRNQIKVASGSTLEFWRSAASESARFDSNGNLVIGTTAASARLHVRGDGTNPVAIYETNAGTEIFRISHNGGIQSGRSIWVPPIVTPITTGNVRFGVQSADNSWQFEGGGNTNFHLGVIGYSSFGASSGTVRSIQSTSTFAATTGTANYRPLDIAYTINNTGAVTGTATGIYLNATETALNGMTHNLIDLQMNSVSRFSVSRLGGLTAEGITSNSNIIIAGTASYQWLSRSRINSPSDGVITLLNNGSTDFGRLQLGGTTNAFPAIKRNGAAIDFRLADDSGYATIYALSVRTPFIQSYSGANNGRVSLQTWNNMILNLDDGGACIEQGLYTSPNASAIFQLNSTTKGFLTPRMTTANFNSIASKAQGLEAYSTDDAGKLWFDGTRIVGFRYNGTRFQGYNGSTWVDLN